MIRINRVDGFFSWLLLFCGVGCVALALSGISTIPNASIGLMTISIALYGYWNNLRSEIEFFELCNTWGRIDLRFDPLAISEE